MFRNVVAAAFFAATTAPSGATVVVPTPSHHWQFQGDLIDSVRNLSGAANGNVTFSSDHAANGRGESVQLGCCDAGILLDDSQLRQPFSQYTISLWFREEAVMGDIRYIYEEGAAFNGIAIRLNGMNVEAAVIEGGGGPGNVQAVAAGPVALGEWHHVSLVYTNGNIKLFLDGQDAVEKETGLGEMGARWQGASIGTGGLTEFTSSLHYVGLVDDLKIWNELALTGPEVKEVFEGSSIPPTDPSKPNIILFVADDLNYDSPGFMGGVAPDVTPNLDRLANESIVFTLAHAAVSVCQPSRQAMLSGKYPPNYGNVGFFPMAEGTDTAVSRLSDAGYITANLHKMWHMQPASSFPWNITEDSIQIPGREDKSNGLPKQIGHSPQALTEGTRAVILEAKSAKKPFFLVLNSADPHRPFHGSESAQQRANNQFDTPSRIYSPDEVTMPNPLEDIPTIREDIARYASSVRRLDDAVGACLQVLEEEGLEKRTVVIFVSDNGMPLPFGKFETYRDSLNGPMLIKWPEQIEPRVDSTSLVSLTDIAPTLIEIVGAEPLSEIEGRTLLPLIRGDDGLVWRDTVVGSRYEEIFYGNFINQYPDPEAERAALRSIGWEDATDHVVPGTMKRTMNKRSITDGRYQYIYNHFYDEDRQIVAFPYTSQNFRAMQEAAQTNATIALRVNFFKYRSQEEFYDNINDPGFRENLMEQPSLQPIVEVLQQKLLAWMVETNDPVTPDYEVFLVQPQ